MPRARRRNEDDVARLEAEIEAVRPFLGLAREIHDDVTRLAADTSAPPESIAQVIEALPARERLRVARTIFDRLPPEQQWAVIERVFDDAEIKAALADEHAARLDNVRRTAARAQLARKAKADNCLDTSEVAEHDVLTLGLFREPDVHAAVRRGQASSTCARRLVLRRGPDRFHVVEDVFNPTGGYFVTSEYDRETWLSSDRLPAHALVQPGSISEQQQQRAFEPVLYLGARADFEVDGELREGRLHLGYLTIGDQDVYGTEGATS